MVTSPLSFAANRSGLLDDALWARIHDRASRYDRDNSFFSEDLDELRAAGYLQPRPLNQLVADQWWLAQAAPATALGIGMHLTWVSVATLLKKSGDPSLTWVLDDALRGELFAFGVSEKGNDRVLTDSVTRVEKTTEGYAYWGTKIFTSLSPAWTRLSLLGRLDDQIVHGFITRDTPGWSNEADWDTLGMRATQSYTTHLEGAVVPHERVARIVPVGESTDPFILAIYQSFLTLVSAVYAGISARALTLATTALKTRTSLRDGGQTLEHDPDLRWQIADIALAVDGLEYPLMGLVQDVVTGVDHGPTWGRLLSGVKHRTVETARDVVDRALRLSGGRGYRREEEISRLQRDVLAGVYHPSDTEAVHQSVAWSVLGGEA